MQKTIEFGKIDYLHHGRKDCMVDVEVELRDTKNGPEFAVSGNIWNAKHTDCYSCGQNLDEIKKYISSNLFDDIYRLWKLYHLNGMHAGTKKQEEALNVKAQEPVDNCVDYDCACEYLKEHNLYEDNGYRYGSGWIYEAIPEDDLLRIKHLLN